mgnify:CR=1 FL=1
MQGGGKSLAARAVAGEWGVPLMRMDFGALYNKYYGETERNLRNAFAAAESMSPCVLWIDEIEKGISTDSGIPDFRGPNGIWTKDPKAEKASDIRHYLADPEVLGEQEVADDIERVVARLAHDIGHGPALPAQVLRPPEGT